MAEVARRFEVTRQQVYDWRAAARRGEFAGQAPSAGFVEVIAAPADDTARPPSTGVAEPTTPDGVVEVAVKGGRRLRLPVAVPTAELVRLIRAVEGACSRLASGCGCIWPAG